MAGKTDYKRAYKDLYAPKTTPSTIMVPRMKFALIAGQGDPNGEDFARATEALYAFSYTVKMSYKSQNVPAGYYEYTVFPLEGVWDIMDKSQPLSDKSNFKYEIMIRQPDILTPELFIRFLEEVKDKKANDYWDKIRLVELEEGLCCQVMHIGSYDDEPATFDIMNSYCRVNGYERIAQSHREIYLSDPRKTPVAKLKTILRYRIATLVAEDKPAN